MNTEQAYHIPVLLKESVDGLAINPDGIYVDVTFGGGGHSREILSRLSSKGRLFGFDQDAEAIDNAPDDKRFTFVRSNFRFLRNFMEWHSVDHIDGMLADLGVSWHHFDAPHRGFSFRFDGPLDMRMNNSASKTAADILNSYPEDQLASVFYLYGELRQSRAIARAIVRTRNSKPFATASDLLETLKQFFPYDKEKKFLAQSFQALRIEVNDEMTALAELLTQTAELLSPQGRIAVITYHSLEDRMVKNFLRSGNFDGRTEKDFYGNPLSPFGLINNKVIVPSDEEITANPRSRSAKLRIAQKIK